MFHRGGYEISATNPRPTSSAYPPIDVPPSTNYLTPDASGGFGTSSRRTFISKRKATIISPHPSNFIALKAASETKSERERIAGEILSSETSYVGFLDILVKVYVIPLRRAVERGDPIISTQDINTLFSIVETIQKINAEIWEKLRARMAVWSEDVCIGDIFVDLGPYLKLYTTFIKNYFSKGIKLYQQLNENKRFKQFIQNAKPESNRLDLSDLLLMPVQRIPRYVLLLETYIKNTPASHPDFAKLEEAQRLVKSVAEHVNVGTVDDSKAMVRLIELQNLLGSNAPANLIAPHRKLIREATIGLYEDGHERTDILAFLLNDMLLLIEASLLIENIPVASMFIREDGELEGKPSVHAFQVFTPNLAFTFTFKTQLERDDWLDDLDNAIVALVDQHPYHCAQRLRALKEVSTFRSLTFEERKHLFEQITKLTDQTKAGAKPAQRRTFTSPISAQELLKKLQQNGGETVDLSALERVVEKSFLTAKEREAKEMARTSQFGGPRKFFSLPALFSRNRASVQMHQRNVEKAGWLVKQGAFIKSWRRRWFTLASGYLFYMKEPTDRQPLGQIPLRESVVEVDHNSLRPNCMQIHAPARTYFICATSDAVLDEWMVAISSFLTRTSTPAFDPLDLASGSLSISTIVGPPPTHNETSDPVPSITINPYEDPIAVDYSTTQAADPIPTITVDEYVITDHSTHEHHQAGVRNSLQVHYGAETTLNRPLDEVQSLRNALRSFNTEHLQDESTLVEHVAEVSHEFPALIVTNEEPAHSTTNTFQEEPLPVAPEDVRAPAVNSEGVHHLELSVESSNSEIATTTNKSENVAVPSTIEVHIEAPVEKPVVHQEANVNTSPDTNEQHTETHASQQEPQPVVPNASTSVVKNENHDEAHKNAETTGIREHEDSPIKETRRPSVLVGEEEGDEHEDPEENTHEEASVERHDYEEPERREYANDIYATTQASEQTEDPQYDPNQTYHMLEEIEGELAAYQEEPQDEANAGVEQN